MFEGRSKESPTWRRGRNGELLVQNGPDVSGNFPPPLGQSVIETVRKSAQTLPRNAFLARFQREK